MQLGVLGPVQLTHAGGTVQPASRAQRLLLTALVVAQGRVVPSDRLVDVLWGDDPPARPVHALRGRVHRLRRATDPALVRTRAPGYALGPTVEVDARVFEQQLTDARAGRDPARRLGLLDRGLALWRGPAHVEFADEDVARADARRLEELRTVAVELRAGALRELGRPGDAVPGLQAVVGADPLRHRARIELVRCLRADGQLERALASCRELRSLLREEQGLDLPPEIARLEARLLDDDRARAGVAADRTDPASGRGRPAAPPAELVAPIGRAHDLDRLEAALEEARLVTLVGVGGVGKTTLALRVAHRHDAHGTGATWWCDLAPARRGEVADLLAGALGVRGTGRSDAAVHGALGGRAGLLVLDNLEHVVGEGRRLVVGLLRACPRLRVLVTSRTPLGAAGERVVRLDPLSRRQDAVALLVERTRAAGRTPVPATDDPLLPELVARLDGLPLALELAASRLRSLSPQELLARLDDRFTVLADERREVARHRGLRAVLDWSHGLLSAAEQRVFRRLAVFPSTFGLADAEAVAAGDGIGRDEVLDLLQRLVDHSLVVVSHDGGETRHRLLETLRAYAGRRLVASGEEAHVRRRHAERQVAVAEEAAVLVGGRQEARGVAVFEARRDDRRAALRWLVEQELTDAAMRLCAAGVRHALWRLRGEEFRWAERVLGLPGAGDHRLLPVVAGMVGWGAALRGETAAAAAWADRGLAAVGDDDPRALLPLEVRMHLALWSGDLAACLRAADRAARVVDDPGELVPAYVPCLALTYAGRAGEALERLRPAQERARRWGSPTMQALVAYTHGEVQLVLDPPRADEPLRRAVALASEVDNQMVLGVAEVSLASLRSRVGRTREAVEPFAPMIRRLHERGDWTHLWTGLRSLVPLLVRLGHPEQAAELLGAVTGAAGTPEPYGDDAERLARVGDQLAEELGQRYADELRRRGAALEPDAAVALAREAVSGVLAG